MDGAERYYNVIYAHVKRIQSGDPGDWNSGPDKWKKDIVKALKNVEKRIKRGMKGRTRVKWEDWVNRFFKWLENTKGPPPPKPT